MRPEEPGIHTDRRAIWAGAGALASVIAASSCCLPLMPFVAAAGLAGGSAFLATMRPYLLAAAVLLIGYGFYQARRARRCGRRPGVLSAVVLWASAAIVAVTILFPQALAALLAG